MQYERDLVVVVPDKNAQFLFRGILERSDDLGLRRPLHQIETHLLLRDQGCVDADELLQSQTNRFNHALVMVADHDRSGHSELSRYQLEAIIEQKLAKSGWDDRASAIVVEPGIARWLLEHEFGKPWSQSTSVERALDAELRARKTPRSPELYRTLGARMIDEGESDPAWRKMIGKLFEWFAANPTDAQPRGKAELAARFDALVEKWLKDTQGVSSFTTIVEHPAYREIIRMGPNVIPLILRDLEREPKFWGTALRELTGVQPVPKAHAGKVKLMAADWLAWAKENGYVW